LVIGAWDLIGIWLLGHWDFARQVAFVVKDVKLNIRSPGYSWWKSLPMIPYDVSSVMTVVRNLKGF
jgi:hypothetical protein